jgi:hypothetical protein
MADSTRVRGSIAGDCEGGCGERGKRGRRGHRGPAANTVPTPPFEVKTTTIYARANGSDEHGDGSLDKPFATFQQAIRFVPHVIPPGNRYVVDITGIGVETLPPDYTFPVIKNGHDVFDLDFADPTFVVSQGFEVRATPQPVALVPAGDAFIAPGDLASVVLDPDTGLLTITLTVARPSWGVNGLVGKFLMGLFPLTDNLVIWSNTTTVIQATCASFIVGPPLFNTWTISEPSATLSGSTVLSTNALNITECNNIGLKGLGFVNTDGIPSNFALSVSNCGAAILENCDVEGVFNGFQIVMDFILCYVHGKTLSSTNAWVGLASYFADITAFVENGADILLSGCVVQRCPAIGPRVDPAVPAGRLSLIDVVIQGSYINAPVVDGGIFPVPADGVTVGGGVTTLSFVKIDGCPGNAVTNSNGNGFVNMEHVTGVTGNVGFGVQANDGTNTRIIDAATTVRGLAGAVQSGSLAPVPVYPAFPTLNSFDIPPSSPIAVSTGTRIYQRA